MRFHGSAIPRISVIKTLHLGVACISILISSDAICIPKETEDNRTSLKSKSRAWLSTQTKVKLIRAVKDISVGEVVNLNDVQQFVVDAKKRPPGTIYDMWIAIGRAATKRIAKKAPILFSDVLPESLVRSDSEIDKRIAPENLYQESVEQDPYRKIPIVYCIKSISLGARVTANALTVKQIEAARCPADAVGDIWIAVGRSAKSSIKAGEVLFYHQVIPEKQWKPYFPG
jgi:flagella basal body P-ring formation protein FlgA